MPIKPLKFRNRLLFSFLAVFLPLILMGSSLFYYRIKVDLETRIEQELQKSSDSLANLIRTAADISVKNSLQAMATQNFEIAEYYYSKHRSGLISYQEAVDTIEEIFLSQAIGISGYIYCLNSKGDVFIHPTTKSKAAMSPNTILSSSRWPLRMDTWNTSGRTRKKRKNGQKPCI